MIGEYSITIDGIIREYIVTISAIIGTSLFAGRWCFFILFGYISSEINL